ncbi:MAG TPA: MarR family winged helix-turn-helix transcriptional regulator [Bradyrhizobium sp.]|uniref:MarR family winged helix-turn-helix transcriptional regulator n=1 Tax=Bradyrhizobium sp. TaxID=376 RepID=UPI002D7EF61E|nr:MarR family winged helix-turn-helix transcriptional regulator [Bradyrhizobium sp.]HET7888905.1 MarR family winged helix-turn-helix transcriptional regulator [Bradyrhizobium sp.]
MSRQKAKAERGQTPRRTEPNTARGGLPLTVTRPELLNDGTDRDFRKLVHNIFAFMARHESIRDGHARQVGLAGVEYTILISIGHLGLDGDVNVKTIADHLHMSGAFVTTVTSKLQTLGLIEKTQDSVDRRRISLAITEKGKALLRKLAPYQREINDVEFGPLSREDFQTISRILEALIVSSDKAFALQRYKSSIKETTKVA